VTDSVQQQPAHPRRRRLRSRTLRISLVTAALGLAALLAASALAAGTVTIGSASNAKLNEKVLVNAQRRTLYVLTPETAKHLLCTSGECLKFWPPLTVASRATKLKLGAGVHGKLGILHRSNGLLQVTLNGLPLYRFAEDHASGEVNGQNFKGFGGTWHVLSDAGTPSSTAPASSSAQAPTGTTPTSTTPTSTTSTPSSPGYEY
jgi:predicted lipoprotein with Yx(FWY)xxD motif